MATAPFSAVILAVFPLAQRSQNLSGRERKALWQELSTEWIRDIEEAAKAPRTPARVWQIKNALGDTSSKSTLVSDMATNSITHSPLNCAIVRSENQQDLRDIIYAMMTTCTDRGLDMIAFLLPGPGNPSDRDRTLSVSVPKLAALRSHIFNNIKSGMDFHMAADGALKHLPRAGTGPIDTLSVWKPAVRSNGKHHQSKTSPIANTKRSTVIKGSDTPTVPPRSRKRAFEQTHLAVRDRTSKGRVRSTSTPSDQIHDHEYKSTHEYAPARLSAENTPMSSLHDDIKPARSSQSQDARIRDLEQRLQAASEEQNRSDERVKTLQAEIAKLKDDLLRKFYLVEEKRKRIVELEREVQYAAKRQRVEEW